jgi:hypothetical protein
MSVDYTRKYQCKRSPKREEMKNIQEAPHSSTQHIAKKIEGEKSPGEVTLFH